jgi:hypothetical protein
MGATNVSGATFDLQGATGHGSTTLSSGARLLGKGVVRGSLELQPTTSARVGQAGMPQVLPGGRVLVEDFEPYPVGGLGSSANSTAGVWTGVPVGTANSEIISESGNKALSVRGLPSAADPWRGAITDLGSTRVGDVTLGSNDTGTYFFRVRRTLRNSVDAVFGLTDLSSTTNSPPGSDVSTPWDEYAVLLSLDGVSNATNLRAYSDGVGDVVITPVTNGEWLNVWLVVDNASNTYRVATSSGAADGVDAGQAFSFGRRTGAVVGANPLTTFGIHEALGARAEIDDLYFVSGVNLANPLWQSPSYSGETLVIGGDLNLATGASIEIDLADGANDLIDVGGIANLAGTIAVTLAPGYEPSIDEDFTVLRSASLTHDIQLGGPDGAKFGVARSTGDALVLTALSGLAGDYDNNGVVDAADYTVWRDNIGESSSRLFNAGLTGVIGPSQYDTWQANYGSTFAAAALQGFTSTPEPAGILIAGVAFSVSAVLARR